MPGSAVTAHALVSGAVVLNTTQRQIKPQSQQREQKVWLPARPSAFVAVQLSSLCWHGL